VAMFVIFVLQIHMQCASMFVVYSYRKFSHDSHVVILHITKSL